MGWVGWEPTEGGELGVGGFGARAGEYPVWDVGGEQCGWQPRSVGARSWGWGRARCPDTQVDLITPLRHLGG